MHPVSLQISLAPSDLPHAQHILAHQLRQVGRQVDEIVLAVDTRAGLGKFADSWNERMPRLMQLLETVAQDAGNVRVVPIDYDEATQAGLSRKFTGGHPVPFKDHRGGPWYSYVAALDHVQHDLVLHLDSDMLLGGGSQSWVREAIEILRRDESVVACNPLPGPPRADGRLIDQRADRYPHPSLAYCFTQISTRIFLTSLERLRSRLGPIRVVRPSLKYAVLARLVGNPVVELPEMALSAQMRERNATRIDFLGSGDGMWSLHPVYRSSSFYANLPDLIKRVETGDVPDAQRGRYNIDKSFFDFGDAARKAKLAYLKRVLRMTTG